MAVVEIVRPSGGTRERWTGGETEREMTVQAEHTESYGDLVHHSVIKIFASKMGITSSGLHLEDAL